MPLPIAIQYLEKYKSIIKENPLIATEIENVLRWVSYLVSGRFNNSNIISELIYTSSSLLQISNDILLKRAFNWKSNFSEVVERLKIFVTIIEYTQVFFEISAKKLAGEAGKWITIAIIQITKTVIKLILLFKYNVGIQRQIPFLPLDRQRDVPSKGYNPPTVESEANSDQAAHSASERTVVTLPRSGRVIRTLDSAPPRSKRTWVLPSESSLINKILGKEDKNAPPTELNDTQKLAEVLHILRPLVHLSTMKTFGQSSWAPYLVSFGMDVTSLKLMSASNTIWNTSERLELNQRSFSMFLYLMRSPFYDNYTKVRIIRILTILSERIPLFGSLLKPFIQYLPEWQRTYFYVWNA